MPRRRYAPELMPMPETNDPWQAYLEAMHLVGGIAEITQIEASEQGGLQGINPGEFEDFLKAVNRGAVKRGLPPNYPKTIAEFNELPDEVKSQYVRAFKMVRGQA